MTLKLPGCFPFCRSALVDQSPQPWSLAAFSIMIVWLTVLGVFEEYRFPRRRCPFLVWVISRITQMPPNSAAWVYIYIVEDVVWNDDRGLHPDMHAVGQAYVKQRYHIPCSVRVLHKLHSSRRRIFILAVAVLKDWHTTTQTVKKLSRNAEKCRTLTPKL